MKKLFKKHKLMEALPNVSVVDVNVILFSEYEKAETLHSGKNEQFTDEIIKIATGLSKEDIEQLSTPDYTSIENMVREQINNSSEYFFELDGVDIDIAKPKLYDPLEGVLDIEYKVPSVKVSRIADTIKNTPKEPFAYARYLTCACTSLSDDDISNLSVRDWSMLQTRITSFLQEPATYFQ